MSDITPTPPSEELLASIESARRQFRAGEPLPTITEQEWVATLAMQLGKCGVHAGFIRGVAQMSSGTNEEITDERELLREQVIGLIGCALDVIEDIDRRLDDGGGEYLQEARAEALRAMGRIMRQDGFSDDEIVDTLRSELRP